MFSVSVKTHFWACHQLTLPDGSKEPLHSHNWSATANLSRQKLDQAGLVVDFCELKAKLQEIVAPFDNAQLESIDYFRQNNSSAENVAKYVFDKLQASIPKGVKLESVSVIEEPGCTARYTKQQNQV